MVSKEYYALIIFHLVTGTRVLNFCLCWAINGTKKKDLLTRKIYYNTFFHPMR